MSVNGFKYLYFIACMLGFCLGCSFSWTSPMQPLLTSPESPIPETMDLNTIAWLGSINYIGSIFGTMFWGTIVDRLGRKTASTLVAIPYIINGLLTIAANSTLWLMVARLIAGLGNSGSTINIPVFLSEIAQDDLRGFLGSFFSISICIGILFTYIVGTYLKYYGLAICSLMVPIVFLVTFIWLPETPMFLWKSGQTEKAKQSLMWYRGGDVNETENILSKYRSLPQNEKEPALKSLVATRGTRKALIIGVSLNVAVQGSGVFPIINFAVIIFEMCGTSLTAYESAIILGFMQLVSGSLCSLLVDRLGRRFLIICSLVIMTISLGILGSSLYIFKGHATNSALSWIPIVSLSVHIVAFAGGVGAVIFIVLGEIFPPAIRGLAMSKLSLVTAVLGFLVIKLFPTLKDLLQPHGLFLCYSCSCLFFAVFFYFYLPETKNVPQSVILKILNEEDLDEDVASGEAEPLQETNRVIIVKKGIA